MQDYFFDSCPVTKLDSFVRGWSCYYLGNKIDSEGTRTVGYCKGISTYNLSIIKEAPTVIRLLSMSRFFTVSISLFPNASDRFHH